MGWFAQAAPAIAAGGASVGGTIISSINARNENKWARDWNKEMYHQSLADEIAKWQMQNMRDDVVWKRQNEYNEMMWHKMNQYNSPAAQMERFKEAGLNPALIYGQMSNAPGIATASYGRSNIGSGKLGNATPTQLPEFDLTRGLMAYYQFKESSARTNNLEAQNKVLVQDAIRKAAETVNIGKDSEKKDIELGVLKKTAMDAAELANNRLKSEIALNEGRNTREALINAANVSKLTQETLTEKQRTQLAALEFKIRSLGGNPNDPYWQKWLIEAIAPIANPVKDAVKEGSKLFKFKMTGR